MSAGPSRLARWGSPLVVGLAIACLIWLWPGRRSADVAERVVVVREAAPGAWRLDELVGTIEVQAGGSAVLCQQGRATRRAILSERNVASYLTLLPEGELEFGFGFVRGETVDLFSNSPGATVPSQGQHPVGSPALTNRHGQWSWTERSLAGFVGARADPSDDAGNAPEIAFEVEGTFESAQRARGTWTFHEVAGLGTCWSRASGSGTWSASAPAPDGLGDGAE